MVGLDRDGVMLLMGFVSRASEHRGEAQDRSGARGMDQAGAWTGRDSWCGRPPMHAGRVVHAHVAEQQLQTKACFAVRG